MAERRSARYVGLLGETSFRRPFQHLTLVDYDRLSTRHDSPIKKGQRPLTGTGYQLVVFVDRLENNKKAFVDATAHRVVT